MAQFERLGVPVMDEDHPRIEAMFVAASTADDGLADLLEALLTEIAAHFAREEAAMRDGGVPILPQHAALHAALIAEIEAQRASPAEALRPFLERRLPQAIRDHIATADTMTAAFLTGRLAER